jgi:hypothetical protein
MLKRAKGSCGTFVFVHVVVLVLDAIFRERGRCGKSLTRSNWPAKPARGLTGLRHHTWDSVVNAFNPMIYVHCLANGYERSDTSRSTARDRIGAPAKVVTNRRFTNNEVRIIKERKRQPRGNGIDFDILRFSIRQSAVQLGCGRRPR